MRWLLLGWVAMALGCASSRVCPTRPTSSGPPFVWEVRGANGSMTLLGTHHVAREADVPATAWRALDAAEIYVAEADEPIKGETFDQNPEIREALELPEGQSLMKMLPDDDYIELRQRLQLSNRSLARMRPWVALSLLVRTVFDFPDPNMATALFDRAKQRGTPMEFLDTWMLQTVFLDMTVDATDLQGALHDRNLACSITAGSDAYRAGSEASFARRSARTPSAAGTEASAISTREQVWADKLVELLSRSKRVFVAIGVANIVGPTGIAARLQQAGYTVTRVQ